MGSPLSVWFQRAHCFRTSGSTGTQGGGKTEQWYSDTICTAAAKILRNHGHTVHLGLADQYPSRTDIFWAPHCDGSNASSARGCSTGARTTAGYNAGKIWRERWHRRGYSGPDRAHNYTSSLARYYGTGWAASVGTPIAFLTEFAFMTNTDDVRFLLSTEGQLAAALSLADTVSILSGNGPIGKVESDIEMLKRGDSGKSVRKLQDWLKTTGYPITIDGDFGPNTESYVKRFQAEFWIGIDDNMRGVYESLFTAPQLAACVQFVRQHGQDKLRPRPMR